MHADLFQALWLAWMIYWVVAARTAKRASRRETTSQLLAHSLPLLAGAALLAFPMPRGWLTLRILPRGEIWYWLGLAMTIAGLGFACWARVHLGRNWSGVVEVKQDHELVRSGPYGWVRHPIYAGLFLACLGSAVALGQLAGLLGVALILLSFLPKLRREERFMAAEFPDAYPAYRQQVRALVPFVF